MRFPCRPCLRRVRATLPSLFHVLQEYLSVFSPLLLEEAVEGVRSSFEESERKGKGAAVTLTE